MRYFFFLILIFIFHSGFAQQESDNWYFGNLAAMSFASGSPVTLTGGQTMTVEGTAVISDSDGNLLFYTDGVTVWNRVNNVMANGMGLHGGISSSQSALILSLPGSDSLFYIFTTGAQGLYGFEYSIVDMSLQGGFGKVVAKNIAMLSNTTEQLTAARQPNGIDWWVITHTNNTSDFYAYYFTAAGLNGTPVVSTAGTLEPSQIGYIKVSHDGTMLALSNHLHFFFELFDFDKVTGTISNSIYLGCPPTVLGPYGIEFSPNDSILYGVLTQPPVVIQWDVSSGNASQIIASQVMVDTANSVYGGALQLARDGKIYMAKFGSSGLGVIDQPNIYGIGCNFIDNGFTLTYGNCQMGLPNFPPEIFVTSSLPLSLFAANDPTVCPNECINFTDQSSNSPSSWHWIFDGATPSSSNLQNPIDICYQAQGTYDVTLITTNAYGSDTLLISDYILIYPAAVPPVITQSNDTLTCSVASSYQWYVAGNIITGATNQQYIITQLNEYSVVITDSNGCTASDTATVMLPLPQSAFGSNEMNGCPGMCFDFINASVNATDFQWSFPGATPPSSTLQNPVNICYANSGSYDVTLISSTTYDSDTLTVADYIIIYTPGSFTISQNGNLLTCSPSANSYQWYLSGNVIPGAITQTLSITQTGTYDVEVVDSNGCITSATIVVNNLPAPDFSVTDTALCEKFCIDFTDASTNNPVSWQWIFTGGNPSSSTDQNPVNICYNNPGNYNVTLITTNAAGTDTLTLTNYITVYPTPPFPVITQAGTTLTSSFALFYQWQFNSVDIAGATNQSYTAAQTGYYTVIVSDSNGCVNSATYVLITGLEDLLPDGDISIYPNPSNGNIIVQLLNFQSTGVGNELKIEIHNVLGQVIFSSEEKINMADWKKEINLTNATGGVYFLEVRMKDDFVRKKIIISK